MTWPIPTPEEQVRFLRNIQRLLAEGLFVASYKFALVHALADLAVLKGNDSGAPLDIDTKDIAAKVVELYWQQCRPFQIGGVTTGLILQQNTGKQAAIISQIVDSQQDVGSSLFRLKQSAPDRWSTLVAQVDQVVRTMPLWKLQTVGEERLDFLYENLDRGTAGPAWTPREDALLGRMSDEEVARRTGRTLVAVQNRRCMFRIEKFGRRGRGLRRPASEGARPRVTWPPGKHCS
jgi:hypothetical protein